MKKANPTASQKELSPDERTFYRDKLREARYAALADSEAFQQMCFAIESLGKRLQPKGIGLDARRHDLKRLAQISKLLPENGESGRSLKTFDALFVALKDARNDVMHTGSYARHVAADAVTLCLVLEDALMVEKKSEDQIKRLTVGDFMVSTPVIVHHWQTVEHARQVMLLNSFSYLPIWHRNRWWLISDAAMAKYLRPCWPSHALLKKTLGEAKKDGLKFVSTSPVERCAAVVGLLEKPRRPGLWLVGEAGCPQDRLVGVLSPFELM